MASWTLFDRIASLLLLSARINQTQIADSPNRMRASKGITQVIMLLSRSASEVIIRWNCDCECDGRCEREKVN